MSSTVRSAAGPVAGSAFHFSVGAGAPFGPGAVIDCDVPGAGLFEGEGEGDGGDAGTAGGDDRPRKIDATLGKEAAQGLRRFEDAVFGEETHRDIEAIGDMAGF